MMKITSADAAKLLRKLNEEYSALLEKEDKGSTYLAAMGEDPGEYRPMYDFSDSQKEIREVEGKIRKLKHAINAFNINFEIKEFGMHIDEMLVYIPQLSAKKSRLYDMAMRLPRERETSYISANIIDYRYANYDLDEAKNAYEDAAKLLSRAQSALDTVNNTVTFEVDL